MAHYGLSHPYISKLDVKTGTYSDGFKCGTAVGTDVDPQYGEAKVYGDNKLVIDHSEFKFANVKLQVTQLPLKAANVMFGHTVDEATSKVVYKDSDTANFVGYGFYASEIDDDGEKKYIAAVLPKVKFKDTADSYETKGENITFKTPSLTGVASSDKDGEWRVKQWFKTEDEAIAFIKDYLNITE
ncbi:MAG: hypothetical protein E7290_02025 [Lachnospiraceae bacterium]|nr:hypothetical protein [Lachnospiraceae bacterium]